VELWRAFKKMFSGQNVDLDTVVLEPLNPYFIDDKYIPEVVFEGNVLIYNYAIDIEKNTYKVLMSPLTKEYTV
jgi:hypothetical protein